MSSRESSRQPQGRGRRRASKSTSTSRAAPDPATETTPTIKTSGAYSRNFQQNLIDHKVYPHAYKYSDGQRPAKPDNWEEIQARLREPRPSLSPSKFSEEAHDAFVQADADAAKEDQVKESVIPKFAGTARNSRAVSGGILFGNLDPLTDGTLKPAKPDFYEGALPEQLDRQVRQELGGFIVPSSQDSLPMAPNFFLEAKGPDGTGAVAGRQALYNGALGERGIQSLQTYGQDAPTYDNNAHTISNVYSDGQLKMFTMHVAQPNGSGTQPEYCMHQLRSFAMTDNTHTFREGATWFRNARDLAREFRDAAIAHANASARAIGEVKKTSGEGPEKTDGEVDGDEAEETDTDDMWLQSQGAVPSFACETTETTVSSLVDDEDSSESEIHTDKLIVGSTNAPAKRSLSKAHGRHGKRRIC
jgi:hypothetical protein